MANNREWRLETAFPTLESPRTILRLAQPNDVPAIIDYYTLNKSHLAPFEPTKSEEFYTKSFWYLEVKRRLDDFRIDRSFKVFLCNKENPKVIIGSINFTNFVRGVVQACTLGYSLAAVEQGKGYMTEGLRVAIAYLFTEMNLHRIMAAYLPHNQRSGLVLRRLGFQVEGYARDYLMINGQWQDHILTSLINPNWQSH